MKHHTKFNLHNNNLHITVILDLYKAFSGGELTIDTFVGKVKLKGKGFPIYKKENKYGDLIITYRIKIPTNLNKREKELFEELTNLRTS